MTLLKEIPIEDLLIFAEIGYICYPQLQKIMEEKVYDTNNTGNIPNLVGKPQHQKR